MKNLFTLIIITLFCSTQAFTQSQFGKVIEEYYRVNPFKGSFSAFVKALSSDPELLNKTEVPKSDTSLYFLTGEYKVFNPFGLNAEKIDMIFAEREEEILRTNIHTDYKFFGYQIVAYFADTEQNRKMLLKDLSKIKKKLKNEMAGQTGSLKGVNNIEDGEITNYYYADSFMPPLTLSWQTLSKSKKIAITLVSKLAVRKNQAIPAGTYGLF